MLYGLEGFAGKDSFDALDEWIIERDLPVSETFRGGEDPSTANARSVAFRLPRGTMFQVTRYPSG